MRFLDTLEKRFRWFGVPNLTLYLVIGQAFLFIFATTGQLDLGRAYLVPELVLRGEYWRLITFLFIPPSSSLMFVFFALYLFYMMGSALEGRWGAFRYTLFILLGYLLTVAISFITPFGAASNVFLGGTIFLAFAYLYPDFELYIFFILPVKIKWLALITWIGYGYQFIAGSGLSRLLILASIGNFLIFFGNDILWRMKTGKRKMSEQAKQFTGKQEAFHRCEICKETDLTHPSMEFRYCPECGGLGYCMEHIENHEHKKK